jgi:hypothetical protein
LVGWRSYRRGERGKNECKLADGHVATGVSERGFFFQHSFTGLDEFTKRVIPQSQVAM